MTSLNQARIINALEVLVAQQHEGFIYDFLLAYGAPRATINRLKMGDSQRNVACVAGDVAVPQKLYFRAAKEGASVADALDEIISLPLLEQHKIRFVLVTDFVTVAAYDRKVKDSTEFDFSELSFNYEFFLPLTGKYEKAIEHAEHPADVKACEKMGRLYDSICAVNHYGKDELHTLNVFLTRLLFCFFAEDTGIFPQTNQMTLALKSLTQEDGSDLANFFERLFLALSLPNDAPERQKLSATFQKFPYVNGGLFQEVIHVPQFNTRSRKLLLECGSMAWSDISPVIFGSMFQSVMVPEQRRSMGAHYTSEKNILKLVRPLFLDELSQELEHILSLKKGKKAALQAFQSKLGSLGFLDPACGCGNFLVVSYRELKELELQVVLALRAEEPVRTLALDVKLLSKVNINQFYGIEIEEFPVEIARVSMWLMEHVMNVKFGKSLGCVIPSIPLRYSAKIMCTNALTVSWEKIFTDDYIHYIFGNPPFVGRRNRTKEQQAEVAVLFPHYKDVDYVACWLRKAATFIASNNKCKAAFVSTNSIIQGEQVHAVWSHILTKCSISIDFAYKTFKWRNEAKNNAVVHCIIIGFSAGASHKKYIFDENNMKIAVRNISPYLIDDDAIIVAPTSSPLCSVPKMQNGNVPLDGDALKIEASAYKHFENCKYVKQLMGGEEFLKNKKRYVLWLVGAKYNDLKSMPKVLERVEQCKQNRLKMKDAASRSLASTPMLFRDTNNPKKYVAMPIVSSENRRYIPMGYLDQSTIPTNQLQTVPGAGLYHFGILTSSMHMVWMRTVCGRLEMRYRYSASIVYNTFPWPSVSDKQKKLIESFAQGVLDAREMYPDMNLAQLYDQNTMPEILQEAHTVLDFAVDELYRSKPFTDDEDRLRLLFNLYAQLAANAPVASADYDEEPEDD